MQHIVTDQIVWSVSRSVGRSVRRSDTQVSPAKMAEPIQIPFGLRTRVGSGNHVLDGNQIPHGKWQFWGGKRDVIVKYRDTAVTVQKRLNRSICCLGCGLGWDEGNTCSVVFGRWRQCAQVQSHSPGGANELSVCGGDAAFMLNYVDHLFFKVLVHFACLQKINWNVNIYIYNITAIYMIIVIFGGYVILVTTLTIIMLSN